MTFKETFHSACLVKCKEVKRKLTGQEIFDLGCAAYEAFKPKARAKAQTSTDRDWITDLEQDPALAGIDVKKQLVMAQFWCKNNRRVCTRKFFINWLQRADRTITVNADGMTSKVTVKMDIYKEPVIWGNIAERIYGHDVAVRMIENGWSNVSPEMRLNILKHA